MTRATRERIEASGPLVPPGMIDTHAHVCQDVTGKFGLSPDLAGVGSGVITLVDQGGPSCMTVGGVRPFIARECSIPASLPPPLALAKVFSWSVRGRIFRCFRGLRGRS